MFKVTLIRKLGIFSISLLIIIGGTACYPFNTLVSSGNTPSGSAPASGQSSGDDIVLTRRPVPTPLPTMEIPVLPTPTPEPDLLSEDRLSAEIAGFDIDDIASAYRARSTADALRVITVSENLTTGERQRSMVAFIRPDSFHIADDDLELIITGGQTYSKEKGANWFVSPREDTAKLGNLIDPYIDSDVVASQIRKLQSDAVDLTYLGRETFGGKAMNILSFSANRPDSPSERQVTVWLGTEDGLLYRQLDEYSLNGHRLRELSSYRYGSDVEIEAPFP